MLEIAETKRNQSHGWVLPLCQSHIWDASVHLHWVAPDLTLRAKFKGEQFPSGGSPSSGGRAPCGL